MTYTDADFERDCLHSDYIHHPEVARIIADRNRWKSEYAVLLELCDKWERNYHELGAAHDALEAERDALKAEVERLSATHEVWMWKAAEIEDERDALKAEVERLTAELTAGFGYYSSSEATRLAAAEAEVERLKAGRSEMGRIVDKMESRLAAAEKVCETAKALEYEAGNAWSSIRALLAYLDDVGYPQDSDEPTAEYQAQRWKPQLDALRQALAEWEAVKR